MAPIAWMPPSTRISSAPPARKKKSAKRGGDARDLTLDDSMAVSTDDPSILDLDNAIGKLAEVDERLASTIELVFFGGLTYEEAADVQGVSKTTLHDDLRLAKAWLKNYMSHADEQQGE
jgi:DNA-directed RNA polymerase specialized sigma24 family protein